MNPATWKSFDRMLHTMERRNQRPKRKFTTSPVVLGRGLALSYVMLRQVVPALWEVILPDGLSQVPQFRGWPGLVRDASLYSQAHGPFILATILAVSVFAFVVSSTSRVLRGVVWLLAVGAIALNAGILFVTIRTAMLAANIGF